MKGLERARSLAMRFAISLKHVLPPLFGDVVNIAARNSPSSAFSLALALGEMRGLDPAEKLGLAKLSRWLAVVRRDYGDAEFQRLVSEIASIVGVSTQSQPQQPSAQQRSATSTLSSRAQVSAPKVSGIVPGIYRYGKYDWLGEVRVEKIAKFLEKLHGLQLPQELQQLALEVFHSLYLLNTELHPRHSSDEVLRALAEITKPVRESDDLRKETVLDEMLSMKIAADIVAEILRALERCLECRGKGLAALLADEQQRERVVEAVEVAVEKARQSVEKDKEVLKVVGGLSASKIGHEISFDDKIELYKLLRDRPVFVKTILEAIETLSDERGRKGDTIEFAGYKKIEDYSELARARVTEYVYPETLFLKRLATRELQVRRYEEGVRGRKRKYIVMIDKSGSMGGEKIEWAKAVAVALLLLSDTDDVKVAFFDTKPFPEKPVELAKNLVQALTMVLDVEAGGGTSIDRALEYADSNAPGYTTVLITDGEDAVSYVPRNETISVMVFGENESLKKVSKKYVRVNELSGKLARALV